MLITTLLYLIRQRYYLMKTYNNSQNTHKKGGLLLQLKLKEKLAQCFDCDLLASQCAPVCI